MAISGIISWKLSRSEELEKKLFAELSSFITQLGSDTLRVARIDAALADELVMYSANENVDAGVAHGGAGHGLHRRGEEAIERAEALYRSTDRERLSKQIAAGDLRAARNIILTEPKADGDADPAVNEPG